MTVLVRPNGLSLIRTRREVSNLTTRYSMAPSRPAGARAAMALQTALPQVFLLAHVLGDPAAEDEEHVAEPVDVLERPLAERLHPRGREQLALGPPAHRAGQVHERVDAPAPRQRERLERGEVFLAVVHEPLERSDLLGADLEHALVFGVRRRGQLAAEVEQLVLDAAERFVEPPMVLALGQALLVERAHEPHHRVQLVDGAVS